MAVRQMPMAGVNEDRLLLLPALASVNAGDIFKNVHHLSRQIGIRGGVPSNTEAIFVPIRIQTVRLRFVTNHRLRRGFEEPLVPEARSPGKNRERWVVAVKNEHV